MGSAFGAGSSGSVFGAAGAANFLSRATRWAAIIFFVVTAGLAWAVYHPKQKEVEADSVMQGFESVVPGAPGQDRKSTRLNSSHVAISYAVFCLKKKKKKISSRNQVEVT